MTVRERVVRGRIASEHTCQFFDSDESRAVAVAAHLQEGLLTGDPMIVIARPVAWVAVAERLDATEVRRGLERGTLVVKDAMEILRRISPGGTLSPAAFDEVVGARMRALSAGRRVRAYGEMVDILAQRGDLAEAVALEGLWNRLSETVPCTLMCGYSAAHFVASATHRSLRDICAAHSVVNRGEQDALANWLLTAAHNSVASSRSLSN